MNVLFAAWQSAESQLLMDLLYARGHRVVVAADRAAIENALVAGSYSLVVCPADHDSTSHLAGSLKRFGPDARPFLVAISSTGEVPSAVKLRDVGVDDCWFGPFTRDAFDWRLATIERLALMRAATAQIRPQPRPSEVERLLVSTTQALMEPGEGPPASRLEQPLRRLCRLLSANGAIVVWWDEEQRPIARTSCEDPAIQWPTEAFAEPLTTHWPWLAEQLRAVQSVRVERMSELTGEAPAEARAWHDLGIRSFMAVPLAVGQRAVGCVICVTVDREVEWAARDVQIAEQWAAIAAFAQHRASQAAPLGGPAAMLEQRIKDRTRRLALSNEWLRQEIGERKKAEAALAEVVERFELAATGSNDGLWDGRIGPGDDWLKAEIKIWFSPRLKSLLGFEDWEFANDLAEWQSRLHPEDHDRVIMALDDHLKRHIPYDISYRLKTKDGSYRWYQARGEGLWDAQGRAYRMAGSLRDITERRLADEALRESEERYRVLVELSPDSIAVIRGEELLYINPAGLRMLGLRSFAEISGRTLLDFVPPKDREQAKRNLAEMFSTPPMTEPKPATVVRSDGEILSIEVAAAPIFFNGEPAVMCVTRDITERKRAEEAVLKEQQLLRQLLDSHERERQLVAYEIHDGLVQYLTGAVMRLHRVIESEPLPPGECRDDLELALHFMQTSLREGRRLISGLRPPILDESGIVLAIEYLIQEPQDPGQAEVEFIHDVQFHRLTPLLESALFRITQEALTNARRYSKAQHIRISLVQGDGVIRLGIHDDGVGFDPRKVHEARYGLQGIRERSRLLGGGASIQSSPGQGTQVDVTLPILLAPSGEAESSWIEMVGGRGE